MDPKAMPRLDDHLVQEGVREEVLRGRRIVAAPAEAPHAECHSRLNFLMSAAAAVGYVASSDLLTRTGPTSEIATDTSVRREGIDPATGTRYLEELAFEVVSTQSLPEITERAEELSNRGVRRLMAVFVNAGEIAEWSASAKSWIPLSLDSTVVDPALARPLLLRALFDAEVADNEVLEALAAKGNPRIAQLRATWYEQGLELGRRKAIQETCEVLGIEIGPTERTQLNTLDAAGLQSLLNAIKTHHRWPQ
jgi:hypothetical protein